MKNILLILILMIGFTAQAKEVIHSYKDTDLGEIQIRVNEVGEPSKTLNVWMLCYDTRTTKKNSITPKWEKISGLSNLKVREFWPRTELETLDQANKELHVVYSTTLENHIETVVDLRAWCYQFRE